MCDQCPLPSVCNAYGKSKVDQYPKRIRRPKTPEYQLAVGVVHKNGCVLITRRKPEGLLGGMWEFPNGKIKKEKSAEAACVKRIREEVNLAVEICEHLTRVRHAYTHLRSPWTYSGAAMSPEG